MPRPGPSRATHDRPSERRVRVFAFDPGVRADIKNLSISELTLKLLWEDGLEKPPAELPIPDCP